MEWTDEQQRAIDFRNGNLLVSAAAGSGKTAVLVERIIKRVTDPENPIGVDSLVVVTFTRAAAEEMKTRLGQRLEALAEEKPGDRRLIKQLSLLDSAKIMTIDSFCTYILRNYYNTIGFDPSFRVADAGELSLIKSDVFKRTAEAGFASGDEDFVNFVESFAAGKGIDRLEELVFGLYDFAQSNPWPDEWLDGCLAAYKIKSAEEYGRLPIVRDTAEYIRSACLECADEYGAALELCGEPSGPSCYKEMFGAEKELFERAAGEETLDGLERALSFDFGRLPAARGADGELKDRAKAIRDAIKKRRASICEKYLTGTARQYEKLCACARHAEVIIGITKAFASAYREAKTEKGIVDFSDIEHYALDILIEKRDGEIFYTETADELANEYDEIYIDEYQDSNLVQEYILGAVSKERFGSPDTFMVGDVKQSIYKFRMAKPELFMGKYDTYSPDGGSHARVELHRNFRSRANVLDCVNDVFFTAMKRGVGGVDYTEEAQLNYGGAFTEEFDDSTELIIADKAELDEAGVRTGEAYAHMAADRIRSLIGADKGLSYRDIVILLRSDKKSGPLYASVLKSSGIPCVYESSTGYFDAYEVKCVMDLLRIIDN
ncbi:MAG: UvrD-helicase domain-containing protein, partial [Butyrivibrio sp.]|nr:UvrD-helicase domain-containing protein [Butyrivibrio sp.]